MYADIFAAAWDLMCTQFTINGFTISYGAVYVFSLLCILLIRAIFLYLLFAD